MNQLELQTLTLDRIKDAQALIRGKRWSFAYYVAGYSVECALKSCLLARMIHTGWVFQDKAKVEECLTHDFGKLIRLAGLLEELGSSLNATTEGDRVFSNNWSTVGLWKVTDRYLPKTKTEATSLYQAITDEPHGVLPWIMKYW